MSEPPPAPTASTGSTTTTAGDVDAEGRADDGHSPVPWHLWLLLAAVAVYLGYRALQGLELLFGF